MFTPDLSVIPAEAGTQRLVGLDSRLRGNDKSVGFIQTYKGIFVATTFGHNQHVVMLNLFQHPCINLEIPKQVRNDMVRGNDRSHSPFVIARLVLNEVRELSEAIPDASWQ